MDALPEKSEIPSFDACNEAMEGLSKALFGIASAMKNVTPIIQRFNKQVEYIKPIPVEGTVK